MCAVSSDIKTWFPCCCAQGYLAWWVSLVCATLLCGGLVWCGSCCQATDAAAMPALPPRTQLHVGLPPRSIAAAHQHTAPLQHAQVQFAGIQDEFLRSRVDEVTGEVTFHQLVHGQRAAGQLDERTSTHSGTQCVIRASGEVRWSPISRGHADRCFLMRRETLDIDMRLSVSISRALIVKPSSLHCRLTSMLSVTT
jgi:hypothetical protein